MERVLLVGAGNMAIAYSKVLCELGTSFCVVGRGEEGAKKFEDETGIKALCGGIEAFMEKSNEVFSHAIIAVDVMELKSVALSIMNHGIRNILLEKPGGLNSAEVASVKECADRLKCNVYIAYNRRFYASTKRAMEIIDEDGGVSSFHFEFTEWSNKIGNLKYPIELKEQWIYANSSHVIDLAFFLGGEPKDMVSYSRGNLSWHKKGAVFSGAGVADSGALFSYQANWSAPGRWSVEILTNQHRLIFRPMEQLSIQRKDSISIEPEDIDDRLDKEFKPGLYEEVESFIHNKEDIRKMTIHKQLRRMYWYERIEAGNSSL